VRSLVPFWHYEARIPANKSCFINELKGIRPIVKVIKLLLELPGGLMNRLSRILIILCTVLFLGVGVASADTLPGELSFALTGPVTATFSLPTTVSVPTFESQPGFGFIIPSMVLTSFGGLTINGSPSPDFLAFYNATGSFGGGLLASPDGMTADIFLVGGGQQLYSGSETSPMFSPGTFTFSDGSILTISGGPAVGTPEPSVTILLGIGLLAVGLAALRYKCGFVTTVS
jgi:hypothetical protein